MGASTSIFQRRLLRSNSNEVRGRVGRLDGVETDAFCYLLTMGPQPIGISGPSAGPRRYRVVERTDGFGLVAL